MKPEKQTVCLPFDHHFIPKRQETSSNSNHQRLDITEVFCDKCGTAYFLTSRPAFSFPGEKR